MRFQNRYIEKAKKGRTRLFFDSMHTTYKIIPKDQNVLFILISRPYDRFLIKLNIQIYALKNVAKNPHAKMQKIFQRFAQNPRSC